MTQHRVVIVGAGLAGLAAAETFVRWQAERSSPRPPVQLTVLEAKRLAGGRAGSYTDSESGQEIDYCQHAAMGCCTNFLGLMSRCGLIAHFKRWTSLHFLHPDHPPSRFAPSTWLPAPLHLASCIDGLRFLNKTQRRQIKRGLLRLVRTPSSRLADVTAWHWLEKNGQSPQTIRAFWDVILVSALGEESNKVSMIAARKVLIDGFAAARGASDVLVPTLPLSELFGRRLVDHLRRDGVEVRTGAPVKAIDNRRVLTADQDWEADIVICATPWYRTASLLRHDDRQATAPLPVVEQIASEPTSPISGLHLWFDRPITHLDHAVFVGTNAQWLFQDPCRDEQSGDQASREHYYQVVISASSQALSLGKAALLETVLDELRSMLPECKHAELLRSRIVTDPKSVFSISPEFESRRPGQTTDLPWLFLAGDWTQTGWPATMEGAVISGQLAAKEAIDSITTRPVSPGLAPDNGLRRGLLSRCLIRA